MDLSEVAEKARNDEGENVRKKLGEDRGEDVDPCGVCEASPPPLRLEVVAWRLCHCEPGGGG